MKKTAKSLVDDAMVQVTTYTAEQARALHGRPACSSSTCATCANSNARA